MSEERKGEEARSMDDLFADLDRARKNFDSLEKQSLEAAKLYGDIAQYAGQIISSVDDTRRFLDPLRVPEIARDPTIGPVLEKMGTQVNTIVVHSDKLIAGFKPAPITWDFVRTNMSTAVSSSSGLVEAAKGVNLVGKYLFPDKVEVPPGRPAEESRRHAQEELDRLLDRLDGRFGRMRRGIWMTLGGVSDSKVMEARHMTRELLAQVLQALAPEDQVSQAKWFVKGSNVTRKNRVRFVISGEEGERSESEEDVAEKLMDMCDTLYGKLSGKFAHAHEDVENKSKEALLKSMVRMTEEALLILLRHRFPAI